MHSARLLLLLLVVLLVHVARPASSRHAWAATSEKHGVLLPWAAAAADAACCCHGCRWGWLRCGVGLAILPYDWLPAKSLAPIVHFLHHWQIWGAQLVSILLVFTVCESAHRIPTQR
jgi:hypothetical protein